MRLHHLRLWILLIPAFTAPLMAQTSGVVYVNTSFIIALCQPQVTMQRVTTPTLDPVYQYKMSFSHCTNTTKTQPWLPFTLKLGTQKSVLSVHPQDKVISFAIPANNSTPRLEMNYD